MEIQRQQTQQQPKPITGYTFENEEDKYGFSPVHKDHFKEAAVIDSDKDHRLTNSEIKNFLQQNDILRDPYKAQVNEDNIMQDYKTTLAGKKLPQVSGYHTYEQMQAEMTELAEKYPDLCQMTSIGKSYEGRDIWAMKITNKNSEKKENEKPSVLITGLHHAREWITLEVPLFAAKSMLENYEADPAMQKRLDNGTIIFVPMVNPDGYEYSRTKDPWWRKNRHPQETNIVEESENSGFLSRSGEKIEEDDVSRWGSPIGTDLNRNYYDGNPEHMHLYRPPGDTPESTRDDTGASDYKSSDTYRGKEGGKELELAPIIEMEKNDKNIKGTMDFHSYGRLILYPWGYDREHEVNNVNEYKFVAEKMSKIIADSDSQNVKYRVMQSGDMYEATGSSEDFQKVNNILGLTVELGTSFAPREKEIAPICQRLFGAQMYMMDYVIENKDRLRQD